MPTSVYDEFMALYPEGTGFDPLQATQVYPFLAKHMGIMLPRAGQDGSLRAAEENLQFDYGGAAGLGFALAVASGTDSVEDIRVELARLVRKSALRCCADFDGLVSGNDVRIMAPAQYGQTFDYQEDLTVDLTVEGAVEGGGAVAPPEPAADLHSLQLSALLQRANEVGVDQVTLDTVDGKKDIIALIQSCLAKTSVLNQMCDKLRRRWRAGVIAQEAMKQEQRVSKVTISAQFWLSVHVYMYLTWHPFCVAAGQYAHETLTSVDLGLAEADRVRLVLRGQLLHHEFGAMIKDGMRAAGSILVLRTGITGDIFKRFREYTSNWRVQGRYGVTYHVSALVPSVHAYRHYIL
jgi:hypothetical protein